MLVDKSEVVNFIPQKPPMVMVDGLLQSDTDQAVAVFCPEDSNLFCRDGFFQEPGILEHIAQAAALNAGYQAIAAGIGVKTGYIGAIKNFKLFRLPEVGEQIQTRILVISKMWNMTSVKGEVFSGEEMVAEAELRIFTPEE